ncbi:hypothetical protein GOODEAATRI_025032 [Goodea atripinnis]|uniref:Uncharacterized protein n=1 Tax=Goodea atripinnis TaxID=208336 RepID=A0ABV0P7N5_9TELE
MKSKEHTKQVRGKVVEKFAHGENMQTPCKKTPSRELNPRPWCKATILPTAPPCSPLFNPSSGNGKSIAQLYTYKDKAVHLNLQAEQGCSQTLFTNTLHLI